jgi:hypothetical protein
VLHSLVPITLQFNILFAFQYHNVRNTFDVKLVNKVKSASLIVSDN